MTRLLKDYAPSVAAALRFKLSPPLTEQQAEEAIQDGASDVWRSIDRFDADRATLRTWFLAICQNRARKILERERGEQQHEQLEEATVEIPRPEPLTAGQMQLHEQVWTFVRKLPKAQRTVLEADLKAGGTADSNDLARRLRTTPKTIYSTRSQGRARLRDHLQSLGYEFTAEVLS